MSATLHVFQCRLHEPCARVWICMHSVMVISIEGLFLNGLRIAQRSAAALGTEKFEKGSVENRHTRYRPATTTRNTDWRCGRAARWTNTPARIFKDPVPHPPEKFGGKLYSTL